MDTDWFAVDESGEVAVFESGEAGAVPEAFMEEVGAHYGWTQLVERLVTEGGAAVEYQVDDLCTEPDGQLLEAVYLRRDGTEETFPDHSQRPTFRPLSGRTQHFQCLLWLRSEQDLDALVADEVTRLPAGSRVIAHCRWMNRGTLKRLRRKGAILRAWVGLELEPWRLGLYHYDHGDRYENWTSGPYGRIQTPPKPLRAPELEPDLTRFVETVRFEGLRFSEKAELQPIEHLVCSSWQSTCVSSEENDLFEYESGQEPLRRVPGAGLILGAALLALDPEQRPGPPYHLGGPVPRLGGEPKLGVALWLARQAQATAPWQDRRLIARLLPPVEAFAASPLRASRDVPYEGVVSELPAEEQALRRDLVSPTRAGPGESSWVTIARRAAATALAFFDYRQEQLTSLLMESARLAAELHASGAASTEAISDAGAFCRALDEELLRQECAGAVVERAKQPAPAIRRVLWRGATSDEVSAFIAALEPGDRFGLLAEIGGHPQWIVGDRDAVLASVPDERFEEATAAVLERE
jgi:hypothetical protein